MNDKRQLIQELVRDRLPALVLYARQWKHGCAEDAVQDAFLKLYQQEPFPAEPLAWLFAVIRNDSNNHLRSQKRRKQRELERPLFHNTDGNDSPDERELIEALQSLPQEHREIITAKIWGGLSFEQIAAVYGTSRSGAHRKYQEGIELLREVVISD
ncbi:MAG: sigma-70 family RNA polymerase sigma factor [Planctomycetaceae bacterium]|nr:sigma-70 family RNA polymerase sigma factor [Planctomycetaceae bacterium]